MGRRCRPLGQRRRRRNRARRRQPPPWRRSARRTACRDRSPLQGRCSRSWRASYDLSDRPISVERGVEPSFCQELVVASLLDDATVLEDDDEIRVPDGRQAVRDDEGGPAREQDPERLLDLPLGPDVDRRRRLVENQDVRVGQQGTRDRDELTLAEGKSGAALLQLCLVAVLEPKDEIVRADRLCGLYDLL